MTYWFCLFFEALGTNVFEVDKPVVFTYEDIFPSTEGFSDSNLLGNGTYGSVYYGVLPDQVCTCSILSLTLKIYLEHKVAIHVTAHICVLILFNGSGSCY